MTKTKYYTYKKDVPLSPNTKLAYTRGKGYWAAPKDPPKPMPSRDLTRAYKVLFAAQNPRKGLLAPPGYKIALSADPEYRAQTVAAIQEFRTQQPNRVLCGWCDCRPIGGTPAQAGVDFVGDYKLDYFIGQAESQIEFDSAMEVHASVVVGNITALNQTQIDRCLNDVLFIQEDYWNEGWGRAKHPAIVYHCAGIYPTALWNPQYDSYYGANRWDPGDGAFHIDAIENIGRLP